MSTRYWSALWANGLVSFPVNTEVLRAAICQYAVVDTRVIAAKVRHVLSGTEGDQEAGDRGSVGVRHLRSEEIGDEDELAALSTRRGEADRARQKCWQSAQRR